MPSSFCSEEPRFLEASLSSTSTSSSLDVTNSLIRTSETAQDEEGTPAAAPRLPNSLLFELGSDKRRLEILSLEIELHQQQGDDEKDMDLTVQIFTMLKKDEQKKLGSTVMDHSSPLLRRVSNRDGHDHPSSWTLVAETVLKHKNAPVNVRDASSGSSSSSRLMIPLDMLRHVITIESRQRRAFHVHVKGQYQWFSSSGSSNSKLHPVLTGILHYKADCGRPTDDSAFLDRRGADAVQNPHHSLHVDFDGTPFTSRRLQDDSVSSNKTTATTAEGGNATDASSNKTTTTTAEGGKATGASNNMTTTTAEGGNQATNAVLSISGEDTTIWIYVGCGVAAALLLCGILGCCFQRRLHRKHNLRKWRERKVQERKERD